MALDLPQFIRSEAKRAEFFAELVKRADSLASLENAEAESRAKIAANRAEADRVLADADERQQAVSATVVATQANIRALIEQSKQEARDIIAAAQDAAAKVSADAINRAADAKKAEQASEADERLAKKRLAKLQEQLAELEPKVAEAQATITKAEAVKKLMG